MVTREQLEQAMDQRFGREVYDKFKAARVCIAGLGGLGSNIALMLARSGIGTLKLIDFDVVDITNLNRQAYRIEHIGQPKTEALKQMIQEVNPYLTVETVQGKVTEDNMEALFSGETLVCEAFDNPQAKAMLVNYLLEHQPETKICSGSGMAGYGSSNEIVTTHPMKQLYLCGDRVSDSYAGIGLLSPRVSLCAAHEANMVLRLLLGEEDV